MFSLASSFKHFLIAAGCFLLIITATGNLSAQIGGGSIVGNVFDQNQAAVPNATVTIVDLGTNKRQTTTTNAEGYYEFPLLPAGRYQVEVKAANFEEKKSQAFDLNTGTRPKIDLALGVAGTQSQVTVTDTGQLVNATSTELGQVIAQQKIDALPLNGRNFVQLVNLQAGGVNAPAGSAGGRGGFELNGGYSYGNNILLDGVDASFGEVNGTANDRSGGSPSTGGSIINTLSVDAIQEFKTTSNAFSAEFGRATSGVLNITTKSGTNDFRGTAYYFLRNDAFDANSFDSNRQGVVRPSLRFHQFGANLGGPVYFPNFGEGVPPIFNGKDKLFFFFNYEGARVKRPFAVNANVPTPLLISQITNPRMRQFLDELPDNCTPIVGNPFLCRHFRNDQRVNDENTFLTRIDANAGDHRVSFRYNLNRQDFTQPDPPRTDNIFAFPMRAHNIVVQDNWTFGTNALNEFRFGFNRVDLARSNSTFYSEDGWVDIPGNLASDNQSLLAYATNTYSIVDNVTFIKGKQTIKFGTDIRYLRSGRTQGTNPTAFYPDITRLINDQPNQVRYAFGGDKKLESDQYGFYIQDDIRLSNRLQINPGLRYEYYTPLVGGFNIQSSDPFSAISTERVAMFRKDTNNFAPRFGAVYDTFGNQKLVFRGGAAISYQPPQPIYLYDHAYANPRLPFNAVFNFADLPADVRAQGFPYDRNFPLRVIDNPSLLPASIAVPRSITDYNRKDEYGLLFNLTGQYAVTSSLAVQLSYVGTRSFNHPVVTLPNETNPATGLRPRQDIGRIQFQQYVGRFRYDAMQVSVNQRLNRNFSFDFYYTFAKSFTYGNSDNSLGNNQNFLQDPVDIGNSYGPKSNDARHRIAAAHTIEIPLPKFLRESKAARLLLGGFSFQGIYTYRTGLPLNIFAGLDLRRIGRTEGSRPDLVAGVDPYAGQGTINPANGNLIWLNPAAFDRTTPYNAQRYGNLSYNALRGASFWNYDASIIKRFRITETQRLDFRFEMFNAFNHANIASIDLSCGSGNPTRNCLQNNGNFGQVLTYSDPRNIQFALKYYF